MNTLLSICGRVVIYVPVASSLERLLAMDQDLKDKEKEYPLKLLDPWMSWPFAAAMRTTAAKQLPH
jgi:hypothetical protein